MDFPLRPSSHLRLVGLREGLPHSALAKGAAAMVLRSHRPMGSFVAGRIVSQGSVAGQGATDDVGGSLRIVERAHPRYSTYCAVLVTEPMTYRNGEQRQGRHGRQGTHMNPCLRCALCSSCQQSPYRTASCRP